VAARLSVLLLRSAPLRLCSAAVLLRLLVCPSCNSPQRASNPLSAPPFFPRLLSSAGASCACAACGGFAACLRLAARLRMRLSSGSDFTVPAAGCAYLSDSAPLQSCFGCLSVRPATLRSPPLHSAPLQSCLLTQPTCLHRFVSSAPLRLGTLHTHCTRRSGTLYIGGRVVQCS
jgi:hypothetical protein